MRKNIHHHWQSATTADTSHLCQQSHMPISAGKENLDHKNTLRIFQIWITCTLKDICLYSAGQLREREREREMTQQRTTGQSKIWSLQRGLNLYTWCAHTLVELPQHLMIHDFESRSVAQMMATLVCRTLHRFVQTEPTEHAVCFLQQKNVILSQLDLTCMSARARLIVNWINCQKSEWSLEEIWNLIWHFRQSVIHDAFHGPGTSFSHFPLQPSQWDDGQIVREPAFIDRSCRDYIAAGPPLCCDACERMHSHVTELIRHVSSVTWLCIHRHTYTWSHTDRSKNIFLNMARTYRLPSHSFNPSSHSHLRLGDSLLKQKKSCSSILYLDPCLIIWASAALGSAQSITHLGMWFFLLFFFYSLLDLIVVKRGLVFISCEIFPPMIVLVVVECQCL